jgi:hypothetical protein
VFWIGHADTSMTDRYSKLSSDERFRRAECARIGIGFDIRPVVKLADAAKTVKLGMSE